MPDEPTTTTPAADAAEATPAADTKPDAAADSTDQPLDFDAFGDIPRRDPSDPEGETELEPEPRKLPSEQAHDDQEAAEAGDPGDDLPPAADADPAAGDEPAGEGDEPTHQISLREYNELLRMREEFEQFRQGQIGRAHV